jgi:hypothetical protein
MQACLLDGVQGVRSVAGYIFQTFRGGVWFLRGVVFLRVNLGKASAETKILPRHLQVETFTSCFTAYCIVKPLVEWSCR